MSYLFDGYTSYMREHPKLSHIYDCDEVPGEIDLNDKSDKEVIKLWRRDGRHADVVAGYLAVSKGLVGVDDNKLFYNPDIVYDEFGDIESVTFNKTKFSHWDVTSVGVRGDVDGATVNVSLLKCFDKTAGRTLYCISPKSGWRAAS